VPATPHTHSDRGLVAGSSPRQRYGLLFVTLLLSFFVQGVATPSGWQEVLVSALLGCGLVLALWTADVHRLIMLTALGVAAAVVATSVVQAATGAVGQGVGRVTDALLVLLAPPAVVIGVLRSLRSTGQVRVEAVLGVLSLYILIGMLWAFVYGAIDNLGGHPFFANGAPATVSHCLYFSFTTVTTVGYGDLTARTNLGHTLAVLEALVGQIYLVTVVSLIVSNLGRSPRRPSEL
jgi:Ion channel